VAKDTRAPYSVLEKVRRGDRDVEIKLKDLDTSRGCRPVLVDDIISSGWTMIAAVQLLIDRGWQAPICIAVHGLFTNNSDQLLAQLGACVVTVGWIASTKARVALPVMISSDGIEPMKIMVSSANLPTEQFVDYSLIYP
jgi:ribose-phosphate pyrophosphokinase